MKTLVMANQKGGVGKTATVVHLAFYMAEKNKKVAVIDFDNQMNASYTLSDYAFEESLSRLFLDQEETLPSLKAPQDGNILLIPADLDLIKLDTLPPNEVAQNLNNILAQLKAENFDYVLIDTAPALGVRLAAALMVADYVISPIELEVYSIQGLALLFETIASLQQFNEGLKFLGILPSRVDNRNPRHKEHLKQLKREYADLLIPKQISLRSSVADALDSKCPVWEIKKTAARPAATEMRSFANYVLKNTKD